MCVLAWCMSVSGTTFTKVTWCMPVSETTFTKVTWCMPVSETTFMKVTWCMPVNEVLSRKSRDVCLSVRLLSRKSRDVCLSVRLLSRKSRDVCLSVRLLSRNSRSLRNFSRTPPVRNFTTTNDAFSAAAGPRQADAGHTAFCVHRKERPVGISTCTPHCSASTSQLFIHVGRRRIAQDAHKTAVRCATVALPSTWRYRNHFPGLKLM